jgi:hypothetical protein
LDCSIPKIDLCKNRDLCNFANLFILLGPLLALNEAEDWMRCRKSNFSLLSQFQCVLHVDAQITYCAFQTWCAQAVIGPPEGSSCGGKSATPLSASWSEFHIRLDLRSGPANLNSAISGISGRNAGPMRVWQEGVLHGQEISAAHPPHAYARVQGLSGPGRVARRQDDGRAVLAVRAAPQPDLRMEAAIAKACGRKRSEDLPIGQQHGSRKSPRVHGPITI